MLEVLATGCLAVAGAGLVMVLAAGMSRSTKRILRLIAAPLLTVAPYLVAPQFGAGAFVSDWDVSRTPAGFAISCRVHPRLRR